MPALRASKELRGRLVAASCLDEPVISFFVAALHAFPVCCRQIRLVVFNNNNIFLILLFGNFCFLAHFDFISTNTTFHKTLMRHKHTATCAEFYLEHSMKVDASLFKFNAENIMNEVFL